MTRRSQPSLPSLLDFRARTSRDALAFADGTETLTFGQLLDDSNAIAASLTAHGVAPGDRVALVLPSGLDFVRAFFALQRIGAIPCAFDPAIPPATTERRVARIRPRLTLTNVPARGTASLPPIPSDEHAIAFLQATSGTSGEPRSAIVLQRNVMASLASAHELLDPIASDVLVGWVPPWHDLGLLRFILGPIYFGIACHLVPPAIRTIPQWLATIASARGTITGAPDFAYRLATRRSARRRSFVAALCDERRRSRSLQHDRGVRVALRNPQRDPPRLRPRRSNPRRDERARGREHPARCTRQRCMRASVR